MLTFQARCLFCGLQSQFHDIAVAKSLGFSTAWIERRHGQVHSGFVCRDALLIG